MSESQLLPNNLYYQWVWWWWGWSSFTTENVQVPTNFMKASTSVGGWSPTSGSNFVSSTYTATADSYMGFEFTIDIATAWGSTDTRQMNYLIEVSDDWWSTRDYIGVNTEGVLVNTTGERKWLINVFFVKWLQYRTKIETSSYAWTTATWSWAIECIYQINFL